LNEILSDILLVLGVGLIVTGLWFAYWPLSVVVVGVVAVAVGLVTGGKSLREGTK
jgi:hypothetical protein